MIQFHCITVSTKWWHQALWYYSSSFCNYNSQMIECFIPLKAAQNHHCSHRHTSVSRQQQALNRTFIVSKLLLWKAVLIVTLEADTNATTMLVMCQSKGGHTSTKRCGCTTSCCWSYRADLSGDYLIILTWPGTCRQVSFVTIKQIALKRHYIENSATDFVILIYSGSVSLVKHLPPGKIAALIKEPEVQMEIMTTTVNKYLHRSTILCVRMHVCVLFFFFI